MTKLTFRFRIFVSQRLSHAGLAASLEQNFLSACISLVPHWLLHASSASSFSVSCCSSHNRCWIAVNCSNASSPNPPVGPVGGTVLLPAVSSWFGTSSSSIGSKPAGKGSSSSSSKPQMQTASVDVTPLFQGKKHGPNI